MNIRYSNIIYYNKLRFYILLSILVKNYNILLSYYKPIFLYFINLLNIKNKANYLDILDDNDSLDYKKLNYDYLLLNFLFYFNYMSLFITKSKSNIYIMLAKKVVKFERIKPHCILELLVMWIMVKQL